MTDIYKEIEEILQNASPSKLPKLIEQLQNIPTPTSPDEELEQIEKMLLFMVENMPKYQIHRGSIFDVVATRMILLNKVVSDKSKTDSYYIKSLPKIILLDTQIIE